MRTFFVLFITIILGVALPAAAGVDIAVDQWNISLQSSNPSRWTNQIAAGEYGEIKIDLLNTQATYAANVTVGFYCDGAQVGETVAVDVPGYGRKIAGSQLVWNTTSYSGQSKSVTVQAYYAGDANGGNNSASRSFYVQAGNATGAITGYVYNRYGQALKGVQLGASAPGGGGQGTSLDTGYFVIGNLPPATYTIYVDSSPFTRAWRGNISVSGGQTVANVNFYLDSDAAKAGTVTVAVRDQFGAAVDLDTTYGLGWVHNGLFLSTSNVDPITNDEEWLQLGWNSPADGNGVFDRIPGNTIVHVGLWEPHLRGANGQVSDYSNERHSEIRVGAQQTVHLDTFVLYLAGTIHGIVTDGQTGAPLADVEMRASPVAGSVVDYNSSRNASTDSRGYYALDHLRPGSYRVTYEGKNNPNYVQQHQYNVVVESGGGQTQCNFVLQPGAEVYGTLSNIGQLLTLTGFYPGPNRGLGIVAAGQLTEGEFNTVLTRIGNYALDSYIVKAFAQKLNLQTGEYSFDYTYPAAGSYGLAPAMWWDDEYGGMTVSVFGGRVQASPGAGQETGAVNLTASTALGRLTGSITPADAAPADVVVWLVPSDRSSAMAGYANPGLNPATGELVYTLPFVPVGNYDLYAVCPGYDSLIVRGVQIAQGATRTLDLAFAADVTAPAAPAPAADPVTMSLETDGLEINWLSSTASDVEGYGIYRNVIDANLGNYQFIGFAPAGMGTYLDEAASDTGTTYRYRITARDYAGNETALGSTSTWTFQIYSGPLDLLTPPPGSTITSTAGTQTCNWAAVAGVDTYSVAFSYSDGTDLYEAETSGTSLTVNVSQLPVNQQYRWQVEGYNAAGTAGIKSREETFAYSPNHSGSIRGRVLNTPIANNTMAHLYKLNSDGRGYQWLGSMQTQASDSYWFTGLAPGTYLVRASLRDGLTSRGVAFSPPINLGSGIVFFQDVTLDLNFGRIAGRITNAAGQPLANIYVGASTFNAGFGENGNWVQATDTRTNANGEFTLERLIRTLPYAVSANWSSNGSSQYANRWQSGIVAESVTPPYLNIVLEEAANVTGLVTDATSGAPLGGISVRFSSDEFEQSATTNGYGSYYVRLVPGNYEVEVAAEEYAGGVMYGGVRLYDQSVGNGNDVVNIRVPRGGSISGTVDTAASGYAGNVMALAFTAGTVLSASDLFNDRLDPAATALVAAGGAYTIGNLATGSYDIYAIAHSASPELDAGEDTFAIVGLMNPRTAVAVTAGATTPGQNFTLPANGRTVSGLLRDGGAEVALADEDKAAVVFLRNDGSFQAVATLKNLQSSTPKAFRFPGLPDGTYTVFGYADGYDTVGYTVTVNGDSAACHLQFSADNTPPSAPQWSSPALAPDFDDANVMLLCWQYDPAAERYAVHRFDGSDTIMLTENARPLRSGDTVYFGDNVPDTGAWRYALVAYDLAGNTMPSSPQARTLLGKAFTAEDGTLQPQLADSGGINTFNPTFTWNAVAGAASYTLYLATDKGLVHVFTGLTGTSKAYPADTTVPKLYPGRMYYWAVEAAGAGGAASRTGWRDFYISSGLTPPRIAHPQMYSAVPGITVPVSAFVTAPGGVNCVTLQYGTASSFTTVAMTADTAMLGRYTATIPGPFIDNLTGFYYRISAVSAGGQAQVPQGNPATWSIGEAYYVPVSNAVAVDGYVCLKGTTYGVDGAQVWVRSSQGPVPVQVLTDAAGHFSLPLSFGDTYWIVAQKHGHGPYLPYILQDTGGTFASQYAQELPLHTGNALPEPGALICYLEDSPDLQAGAGRASGYVGDDLGNPVAGALIVADMPDGPGNYNPDYALTVTDASGRYVLPNLPAGTPFSVLGQLSDANGQPIMRGALNSLTIPDALDTFTVGAGGSLVLRPIMMSARFADAQYPLLLGVADSGPGGVAVRVSEALTPSAMDPSRYTMTMQPGDTVIPLIRVAYQPVSGDYRVALHTAWPLNSGATYRLQLNGLQDWAGNTMPDTQVDFAFSSAADQTPPRLTAAVALYGDAGGGEVLLYFSEPMNGTAQLAGNYVVEGLTVTGVRNAAPGQVCLEVSAMSEGQQYSVSCTQPQDVAGNALAASDSRAAFYGLNSGGVEGGLVLMVLSVAEGQPKVTPGDTFIIISTVVSDQTATVTSAHDTTGITVNLVRCAKDYLPTIVPDGAGEVYAALVVAGGSSGVDRIAAFSGGMVTVAVDSLTVNLVVADTRVLTARIHINVPNDTVQAIAVSPQYPGRLWLSDTAVIPPHGGVDTRYIITVDKLGMYEVTMTRLSDLQTLTFYNIKVETFDATVDASAPSSAIFPATTDTFGIITGVIDVPDTGAALIGYDADGEIERYPYIFVHAAGSALQAGKPVNPEGDLLQLANGDVKYTVWGLPVSASDTVNYVVEVKADGYRVASQGVELTAAKKDRSGVNFALTAAGAATLRGWVKNLVDVPVAGLTVSVLDDAYGGVRTAITDEGGSFEIGSMAAGSYTVLADASERGYVPKALRVQIDTGATAMVNFRLTAAQSIRGTVRQANGSPMCNLVQVTAMPLLAGMEQQMLTTVPAQDGSFMFVGLPDIAGLRYRIIASAPAFAQATVTGVLPGDTNVQFVMRPVSESITGRVVSLDTGLANATVKAISQAVSSFYRLEQANATGTFTVSVPAGYYTLEISKPGYRRALLQNVRVDSAAQVFIGSVMLEDGASVAGRVTMGDGIALAGATVRAVSPDSIAYLGSAITSSSGYYAITGLVKNVNYKLMVIRNNGADVYPYDKLVFLTQDATVNIQVSNQPPQFFVDCQRSTLGDTVFALTITSSKRLQGAPLLAVLAGHGYFSAADSRALPALDRVYRISYAEPDTTVTEVRLRVTGTDLQGAAGQCTYVFKPMYQLNQEVVMDGSQSNQISLNNGASVIVPENAYSNSNDTSTDATRNSVRLRISQVALANSTGGETAAPRYYGAPAYLARYAPPVSGTGRWTRSSNDYDIHLQDGSGETVTVTPGKFLTITLPYTDTTGAALNGRLHLYYFNETLQRWVGEVTGQIVNIGDSTITISVNHLSKFAVYKEPTVSGDVTGDGSIVNTSGDLAAMNVYYPTNNVTGDISGPNGVADGVVDFYDVAQLGQDFNANN